MDDQISNGAPTPEPQPSTPLPSEGPVTQDQSPVRQTTPSWTPPYPENYKPTRFHPPKRIVIIATVLIIAIAAMGLYLLVGNGHVQTRHPSNNSTHNQPMPGNILAFVKNNTISYANLTNSIDARLAYTKNVKISYNLTSSVLSGNGLTSQNDPLNGSVVYLKTPSIATFLFSYSNAYGKSQIKRTKLIFNFNNRSEEYCQSASNVVSSSFQCSPPIIETLDPIAAAFMGFTNFDTNVPIVYLGQKVFNGEACTLISGTVVQNTSKRAVAFSACMDNQYYLPLNFTKSITQNNLVTTSSFTETNISSINLVP